MIRSLSIIAGSVWVIACAAGAVEMASAQPPLPSVPSAAVPTAATAAIAIGLDGLPTGPTHDLLTRVCSACHALEIVTDKRMDRAGWDELVQMMIGRGAQASPEEAKAITDYLATAFPAEAS